MLPHLFVQKQLKVEPTFGPSGGDNQNISFYNVKIYIVKFQIETSKFRIPRWPDKAFLLKIPQSDDLTNCNIVCYRQAIVLPRREL